ncbi:MAG: phosphoribosylanthranilate isomerase [Spirochaetaceae bacterium]|nr:phosphoribosylanthranilate isomerase [Spirochaetaceae bacterium]
MKIKICGLFREEDAVYVNEAEPDYAGFVFAKSKRRVDFDTARKLRSMLKPKIIPVGVFVNEAIGVIKELYFEGIISIAQLHGEEDDTYIAKVKAYGIPVIKAMRIGSKAPQTDLAAAAADFLLFDSGSGSGIRFDWNLLSRLSVETMRRVFLAGGVDKDNIGDAVLLKPYCVDVSSGVESGGFKDREKIRLLVERARKS